MNVTIHVSEELYRLAKDVAAKPIRKKFSLAFEQKMLELERLKEKASRGSRQKFQQQRYLLRSLPGTIGCRPFALL